MFVYYINSMQNIIKSPMSDTLIEKYFNGHANIKSLSQVEKMTSLNQLFPHNEDHVILFMAIESQTNGHWLAIFRNGKNLYYFDSYGEPPLKYINILKQEGNTFGQSKFLLQLIEKSEYVNTFFYNTIEYQQEKNNIATCGRYCTLICILNKMIKNFNVGQFHPIMLYWKKELKMNYDEIVSFFINKMESKSSPPSG